MLLAHVVGLIPRLITCYPSALADASCLFLLDRKIGWRGSKDLRKFYASRVFPEVVDFLPSLSRLRWTWMLVFFSLTFTKEYMKPSHGKLKKRNLSRNPLKVTRF